MLLHVFLHTPELRRLRLRQLYQLPNPFVLLLDHSHELTYFLLLLSEQALQLGDVLGVGFDAAADDLLDVGEIRAFHVEGFSGLLSTAVSLLLAHLI